MLLTITTTHEPATDLGYLLHKNPQHPQSYDLPFGRAHVFYPVVEQARCEAALMLDIDPIRLVRGPGAVLTDYVNDRPYVSSSFMSVALARVLGTALGGRSKERPELAASPIPLRVRIAAVPCRGGASLVEQLFKPLGYEVAVEDSGAEGAAGRYHNIELRAEDKTLGAVLTHVYVLLPVLDNQKHYWIGEPELKKLLDRGKGWLEEHSSRDLIVQRYLGHRRSLTTEARAVLEEARGSADGDGDESAQEADAETSGAAAPKHKNLHTQRLEWVVEQLQAAGAARVVDIGCGEGRLLARLLDAPEFTEIVGADASTRSLEFAGRRLRLRRMPEERRKRIRLVQSGLTYRDDRLAGYDAAAAVEVVEHIDPERLRAFEIALFEHMRPRVVALTTPNREYNARFDNLTARGLRHRDHRFEWTREEFGRWTAGVCERHGYRVETGGIGTDDDEVGQPTLRGLFTRCN